MKKRKYFNDCFTELANCITEGILEAIDDLNRILGDEN